MAETKILNLASFEDVETLKQTTKSQGEEISQVKGDIDKQEKILESFPITHLDVVKNNPTINLINLDDCVSGSILSGVITANEDYLTTDFIEVSNQGSNQTYFRVSTYQRICQFDENKNYLRQTISGVSSLKPSEDVKYIRYSFPVENKDSEMFVAGSIPYSYIPFNKVIPTENLDLPNGYDDVFVNHYTGVNRCDPSKITEENLNQENGNAIQNKGNYCSDYCDILTDNDDMVVSFGIFTTAVSSPKWAFYDKYKRFISGGRDSNRKENIEVPQNAKYIRVSGNGSGEGLFINIGKDNFTKVDYVCEKYNKQSLYEVSKSFNGTKFMSNQWEGKTWTAYGDSITAMSTNVNYGWTNYADNLFGLNPCLVRGVGGTKFSWGGNGGCAVLINSNGEYGDRNESYTKDNYPSESIPEGYDVTRGCLSSWDRITKTYPESIKDNIDMIFVFGGANDDGSDTEPLFVENDTTDTEWASSPYYSTYGGDYNINTMMGGMASCLMKLQAWMPNATIIYGIPFLCGRGEYDMNKIVTDLNPNMWSQSRLLESVAKRCGFPIIDIYAESGVNGWNRLTYVADIIHPTRSGMAMIGQALCNGLSRIYPKFTVL